MKRKTLFIVYGTLAVIVMLVTAIQLYGNNTPEKTYQTNENPADPYEGRVSAIEGTTTDMLSPDYWIKEDASRELFSREETEAFNKNNPSFVLYYSESDSRNKKLFMNDLPQDLSGEIVKSLISDEAKDISEEREEPLYINGELAADGYLDDLKKVMALDEIPASVVPEYAVCIERCVAKTVPSDDFAASDKDEVFFNDFISSEVMPFAGVVILHESADSQWCYIVNGSFCGWVKKDSLAVCGNKEEWLSICEPEDFLVVTGSEIVMDETAVPTHSSGMILPMGTKIALSKDTSETVNGRSTIAAYCVEVPFRNEDGSLGLEKTLVPVSKDVNVGYLAMTSESVLKQAFKFLGKVYGYGGTLSSNDCSGFIRQVYDCYGFRLPRNATAIAEMTDLGSIDCSRMTPEKKRSLLAEMPAGLPLYMDGHIMMYIGTRSGQPYVISSCATTIEPGHDTDDIVDAYCVFVSDMNLKRASGLTWLDDINYILWKEY